MQDIFSQLGTYFQPQPVKQAKKSTSNMTICDDNGIELIVSYDVDKSSQIEECHGLHDVGGVSVDLHTIEIVIAGKGIDITHQLDKKQLQVIEDKVLEMEAA